MNEQLIVVKQLPIIEERLRSASAEVDRIVSEAQALVCDEDSVKAVKAARADLNRRFTALEDQRKAVKAAVLAPYEAFEATYKECVSDKFKAADADLKRKIDDVEGGLRDQKTLRARQYYEELSSAYGIDFVPWGKACPLIKITLSSSDKNIREQIEALLSHFMDDLHVISQQTYKDEILAEYKQSLSLSNSISHVSEIHAAMEAEEKKRAEQAPAEERAREAVERVEACSAPEVIEEPADAPASVCEPAEPVYTTAFRVTGTLAKLKALKQYMIDNGLVAEKMEA